MEDHLRLTIAQRALILLRKEGRMTATDFRDRLGLAVDWAIEVRNGMEKGGLVATEDRYEGRTRFRDVFLTAKGEVAADAAIALDAAIKDAQDTKKKHSHEKRRSA